jgi:hypothetical protein
MGKYLRISSYIRIFLSVYNRAKLKRLEVASFRLKCARLSGGYLKGLGREIKSKYLLQKWISLNKPK